MASRVPTGGEHFNEEEWHAFIKLTYDVALMVGLSPADASDVAQASMISLLVFLKKGVKPRSPESWLAKVAARRSYDLMKTRDRRHSLPTDPIYLPERVDVDDDYEKAIDQITSRSIVTDIMIYAKEHLTANQFAALLRLYISQGGSRTSVGELVEVVEEAIDRLGSGNPNTEKTHQRRARNKVADELPYNPFE